MSQAEAQGVTEGGSVQRLADDERPYVLFKKTVNRGLTDEKTQEWKCYLVDPSGGICIWASLNQIQQYASPPRSWEILGYGGNFDMTDSSGKKFPQLQEILSFVRPLAQAQQKIANMQAQMDSSQKGTNPDLPPVQPPVAGQNQAREKGKSDGGK